MYLSQVYLYTGIVWVTNISNGFRKQKEITQLPQMENLIHPSRNIPELINNL